jgi:hypothetical protein
MKSLLDKLEDAAGKRALQRAALQFEKEMPDTAQNILLNHQKAAEADRLKKKRAPATTNQEGKHKFQFDVSIKSSKAQSASLSSINQSKFIPSKEQMDNFKAYLLKEEKDNAEKKAFIERKQQEAKANALLMEKEDKDAKGDEKWQWHPRLPSISYRKLKEQYQHWNTKEIHNPTLEQNIEPIISRNDAHTRHSQDPTLQFGITNFYELYDELWIEGYTNRSASLCLKVINFRPFFYMQFHPALDAPELLALLNRIDYKPKGYEELDKDPVVDCKIVKLVPATTYQGRDKIPFYQLFFYNLQAFEHYRLILSMGEVRELPHDKAEPRLHHEQLTLLQMFMTTADFTYFDWVSIPTEAVCDPKNCFCAHKPVFLCRHICAILPIGQSSKT